MKETLRNILTNKELDQETRRKGNWFRLQFGRVGYRFSTIIKIEFKKLDFSNYKFPEPLKETINYRLSFIKEFEKEGFDDWQYLVMKIFDDAAFMYSLNTDRDFMNYDTIENDDPRIVQKYDYISRNITKLARYVVEQFDKNKDSLGNLNDYICNRYVTDGFVKLCKAYYNDIPEDMLNWEDWKIAVFYETFNCALRWIKW